MPKPLSKQSKELISNLISYFEAERDNGGPFLPLTAVRERVAHALKLNVSSVSSVSQVVRSGAVLKSPKKTKRCKPIRDIDDFDQAAVRNVIYEMYRNKQHITKASILSLLKERNIFHGGITTLGKVLHDIGFKWKKDDPRRGLMELPHISLTRVNFLQNYMKNKNSEYPSEFVYLDETWIFENGSIGRSWQDSTKKSVKSMKTDGKRFVILHAGNKDGFIPEASLIFCSKTKDPDYHGEMNKENFLKWFEHQLLIKLKEPSIIIMDNASYHSSILDKTPNTAWKKSEICNWLRTHSINYEEDLLKIQLLDLATQNRPPRTYVADTLAEKYGHKVLRLPPYHCIFNPIENIWGIAKVYYSKHIGRDGYGVENVLKMWQEALDTITPEVWSNTIRHTEEEIKKWFDREVVFDREDVAPLIINTMDNEEDSDDSTFEDSDDIE